MLEVGVSGKREEKQKGRSSVFQAQVESMVWGRVDHRTEWRTALWAEPVVCGFDKGL